MKRLREETRSQHDDIESVSFHRRLADGEIQPGEYLALLDAISVVHRGLEAGIARLDPPFEELTDPLLHLVGILERDRRDARDRGIASTSHTPSGRADLYVKQMLAESSKRPTRLLGHLYVNHGSLLGGFHLRPLLQEALDEIPPDEMRYFGGLGAEVRRAWKAFSDGVNDHDFKTTQVDEMVYAARRAFRQLTEVYEEFDRQPTEETPPSSTTVSTQEVR